MDELIALFYAIIFGGGGSGGGTVGEDIILNSDFSLPKNTQITADMKLADIIKLGGYKDLAPTITLNNITTLFKTGTNNNITLTATLKKSDSDLTKVEFYKDTTLVDTQLLSGGTATKSFTYENVSANCTLKVIVYDETNSASTTKTIQFINASYKGTIDSPVEFLITNCEQKIEYTGSMIIPIYRYPASLGNITKIYDSQGVDDYTQAFTKTTETIDGVSYICFVKKEPADGMTYWFKKS